MGDIGGEVAPHDFSFLQGCCHAVEVFSQLPQFAFSGYRDPGIQFSSSYPVESGGEVLYRLGEGASHQPSQAESQ